MRRQHFVVTGRVQGVGFRYFCQEQAKRFGLVGYARNRPDGSVETEAEGDDAALEQFAQAIARGPRAASVSNVTREERELKQEQGFRVG